MNSIASRIAPPGLVEVPMKQISYDSPTPRVDCWVYEVWDTEHRLAYAGIADHFERRWGQHLNKSWWLGEIDVWYIDVFGYRSRWEARQVEAGLINDQHAVYNTSREVTAYRAWQRFWEDPDRVADEFDCMPLVKRRFLGVSGALVQG